MIARLSFGTARFRNGRDLGKGRTAVRPYIGIRVAVLARAPIHHFGHEDEAVSKRLAQDRVPQRPAAIQLIPYSRLRLATVMTAPAMIAASAA
jgi:hypothetical protein